MKFIRNFSRLIVGLTFIFSGLVKGVDPLGTAYRIEDYFVSYGIEWAIPLALFLSVFLCTLEFMLGISMLFNAWVKRTSWLLFPMMIFFTILTLVDAIWEPVPDCGCFGDALKLTNWETFYKNIVLIILTTIIFISRKQFKPPQGLYGFALLLVFTLGFLYFSFYNLNHLPIVDFREWRVGNNMTPESEGKVKYYLLFRNSETGEEKEFLSPDYPWNDSTWLAKWEFVDQREDDSEVLKAHELSIVDSLGVDYTNSFIGNPDYQFLVIAYDLHHVGYDSFKSVNQLFNEVENDGHSLIVITGSLPKDIEAFKERVEADTRMEFYFGDATDLKTMIRSNPGLMLMKDGIILGKWHYNDIPGYPVIREEIMKD